MDRSNYKYHHVPRCPMNVALVDQYMWPKKDSVKYRCVNGAATPIYTCTGDISYTLPLHMYPKDNGKVHPALTRDFTFPPELERLGLDAQRQYQLSVMNDSRLEGLYNVQGWNNKS